MKGDSSSEDMDAALAEKLLLLGSSDNWDFIFWGLGDLGGWAVFGDFGFTGFARLSVTGRRASCQAKLYKGSRSNPQAQVPRGSYPAPFLGRLLFKITDPNHKTRYPKKGLGYEPLGNAFGYL